MAMTTCPDCGAAHSDDAHSCPQCHRWRGLVHGKDRTVAIGCLLGPFVLLFVVLLALVMA